MSHSGDLALFAFARDLHVGIDVEKTRDLEEMDRLVNLILTAYEQRHFRGLPSEHRQSAFFRYWTCKEAFVKATGEGLSRPLLSFEIEMRRGFPERLGAMEPG